MASYVNKKTRVFRTTRNDLEPIRSEARLKTYPSAIDARSWCDYTEDRRQYILELVRKNRAHAGLNLIPIEALVGIMMADNTAANKKLQAELEELRQFLRKRGFAFDANGKPIDFNDEERCRKLLGVGASSPKKLAITPPPSPRRSTSPASSPKRLVIPPPSPGRSTSHSSILKKTSPEVKRSSRSASLESGGIKTAATYGEWTPATTTITIPVSTDSHECSGSCGICPMSEEGLQDFDLTTSSSEATPVIPLVAKQSKDVIETPATFVITDRLTSTTFEEVSISPRIQVDESVPSTSSYSLWKTSCKDVSTQVEIHRDYRQETNLCACASPTGDAGNLQADILDITPVKQTVDNIENNLMAKRNDTRQKIEILRKTLEKFTRELELEREKNYNLMTRYYNQTTTVDSMKAEIDLVHRECTQDKERLQQLNTTLKKILKKAAEGNQMVCYCNEEITQTRQTTISAKLPGKVPQFHAELHLTNEGRKRRSGSKARPCGNKLCECDEN